MKIQCNACESAPATVFCCADEAALCSICDRKVHAANKLAGKHQRVRLIIGGGDGGAGDGGGASGRVPKCDICQESSGYFFCLKDRALLCRDCDSAIHSANAYVAAHERFLLTGIRVGLELTETVGSVVTEQSNVTLNPKPSIAEPIPRSNLPLTSNSPVFHRDTPSLPSEDSTLLLNEINGDKGVVADKLLLSGYHFYTSMTYLPLDEFFKFADFGPNIGFTDQGSSQADSSKHGSSEGSLFSHSVNEELDVDECSDPNFPWMVPAVPSPPTFSGLHFQRSKNYPSFENAAYVPDICSFQDPYKLRGTSSHSKRSRLL